MSNLTKVTAKKDLPPGKAIAVAVGQKTIAVFNAGGEFFAIDDTCTHAGGPLCEGEVDGKVVTCPWHGAEFDLTTGMCVNDVAPEPLHCYQVVVEGEDIKIELPLTPSLLKRGNGGVKQERP